MLMNPVDIIELFRQVREANRIKPEPVDPKLTEARLKQKKARLKFQSKL
jgi:hypothetical protein